jgi:hypothetical protein
VELQLGDGDVRRAFLCFGGRLAVMQIAANEYANSEGGWPAFTCRDEQHQRPNQSAPNLGTEGAAEKLAMLAFS